MLSSSLVSEVEAETKLSEDVRSAAPLDLAMQSGHGDVMRILAGAVNVSILSPGLLSAWEEPWLDGNTGRVTGESTKAKTVN